MNGQLHYACHFQLRSLRPTFTRLSLLRFIRGWIANRHRLEWEHPLRKTSKYYTGLVAPWFFIPGNSSTLETGMHIASGSQEEPEYWALRYRHPDLGDRPLLWLCDLVVRQVPELLDFRLRLRYQAGEAGPQEMTPEYRVPGIVHHLLDGRDEWLCQAGTDPIPAGPVILAQNGLDSFLWYTLPLPADEVVLSLDEKISLQLRTRQAETKPAEEGRPVRLEHEYQRKGGLNLLAAFDTRTGEVRGICRRRKRQSEFIELLERLKTSYPPSITRIHVVCGNARMHTGKQVQKWLSQHPRFEFHFAPVHCAWRNQIEQWFSILQRKRLTAPNFASLEALEERLQSFMKEWNQTAHPFLWTEQSFEKIRRKFSTENLVTFPQSKQKTA